MQVCNLCVMDSQIPGIIFSSDGQCNYCKEFVEMISKTILHDPLQRELDLKRFITRVKDDGVGKPYDCIIGLSGGVDSAWVLYVAKQLGLRPLAVHMDNGWNSELAQSNIEGLVRKLGIDLHTHVIDWQEYRGLMQAFFDADVVDVELLYDNAMLGANYRLASKHGIKWILSGTNKSTEGMSMPPGWNWFKLDARNIRRIASQKGGVRLKTFPAIGVIEHIWLERFRKVKWVSFLDYMDYRKEEALLVLEKECGFRRYPYKHYESIFTRFYQGFILPEKFGIDKRKLHLSTLVASQQMNREDAIQMLREIPYPSFADLQADKQYFLKKMNWTNELLENYLSRPRVDHSVYGSELGFWNASSKFYKFCKKIVSARQVKS
ncbi:MAG: N-acetyl sugar amidotransferase [Pseudohongiella sp.]|nr:N-acetyl sugar amidotransferase [Pseudohongiella sp.]